MVAVWWPQEGTSTVNQPVVPGLDPERQRARKRFAGPKVVLVGFLIIIAITAFVVTRIVQTSGPGPDPNSIPERPS
jgi:hypothetical protein